MESKIKKFDFSGSKYVAYSDYSKLSDEYQLLVNSYEELLFELNGLNEQMAVVSRIVKSRFCTQS